MSHKIIFTDYHIRSWELLHTKLLRTCYSSLADRNQISAWRQGLVHRLTKHQEPGVTQNNWANFHTTLLFTQEKSMGSYCVCLAWLLRLTVVKRFGDGWGFFYFWSIERLVLTMELLSFELRQAFVSWVLCIWVWEVFNLSFIRVLIYLLTAWPSLSVSLGWSSKNYKKKHLSIYCLEPICRGPTTPTPSCVEKSVNFGTKLRWNTELMKTTLSKTCFLRFKHIFFRFLILFKHVNNTNQWSFSLLPKKMIFQIKVDTWN